MCLIAMVFLVACATVHHTPEGTSVTGAGTAYDARLLMDGSTAASAVAKGSDRLPVTVTTRVEAPFGRTSETTIKVGDSAYAPAAHQSSSLDAQIARARAYHDGWPVSNGPVPGAVRPQGAAGVASVQSSFGTAPVGKCPIEREPATQAEINACVQDMLQDVDGLIETVGVK